MNLFTISLFSLHLALLCAYVYALEGTSELYTAPPEAAVAGRYLVTVDDDDNEDNVEERILSVMLKYGNHRFNQTEANKPLPLSSLATVVLTISSQEELNRLRNDPLVSIVTQERTLTPPPPPSPPKKVQMRTSVVTQLWGVDRVNQRSLPIDGLRYNDTCNMTEVDVYVVDTGVIENLLVFEGRVQKYFSITNTVGDGNGHGSSVAAIVTGKTVGLTRAIVKSVKVVGDDGLAFTADLLAGFQSILNRPNKARPAVINVSLTPPRDPLYATMLEKLEKDGLLVVGAAGNDPNMDACDTMAADTRALCVGATTRNDSVASFSTQGSCVDIFAPGQDIYTVKPGGSYGMSEGTSLATPFVTSAAALYLARNPAATPQQVREAIIRMATPGKVTGLKAGTPNRLLYMSFAGTCKSSLIRPDKKCGSKYPVANTTTPAICGGIQKCCLSTSVCGLCPTPATTTTKKTITTTTIKKPTTTTTVKKTTTVKPTPTAAPASHIRSDGRCGRGFPSPLDRNLYGTCGGSKPCCSGSAFCSAQPADCTCPTCCNSNLRDCTKPCSKPQANLFRSDGRCGSRFPASNGKAAECPGSSDKFCCSARGVCGSMPAQCTCATCVNYKVRYGCK